MTSDIPSHYTLVCSITCTGLQAPEEGRYVKKPRVFYIDSTNFKHIKRLEVNHLVRARVLLLI